MVVRVKKKESGNVDFQSIINKLRNPKPLLSQVGDIIVADTQNRIRNTKVSPAGRPWAPWAESTERARQREGSAGGGLLFRTGALYASVFKTVNPRNVVVSSAAPQARFLQSGTRYMPARPFIGISAEANTKIGQLVDDYLGLK